MELIYIFVISNSDLIVICLIGSYLDNIRRTLLNTTHKVLCSTITCHDYWSLSSVIVIVVIFIVVVVDIITSIISRLMSHVSSSSPPPKLTWLPPLHQSRHGFIDRCHCQWYLSSSSSSYSLSSSWSST